MTRMMCLPSSANFEVVAGMAAASSKWDFGVSLPTEGLDSAMEGQERVFSMVVTASQISGVCQDKDKSWVEWRVHECS